MSVRYERSPALTNAELGDLLDPELSADDRDDYSKVLAHSLVWIGAYDADLLVGYCNVAWDGGVHAFLLDPTVRVSHRRQGIGTALVREAIAAAADHPGLEWIHVDSSADLMARFYEPAGFKPTAAGLVWLDEVRGATRGASRKDAHG